MAVNFSWSARPWSILQQEMSSMKLCKSLLTCLISYSTFFIHCTNYFLHFSCIFFKDFIIFRERGREGEKEGESHQCVVASCTPHTGDLAHNPGMCPDRESNRQPFGLQPMLNPLSYTSQGSVACLPFLK